MALIDLLVAVKVRCSRLTIEEIAVAAASAAVFIETIGPGVLAIAQALQDL
jgi:hypothetical protein